MILVDTNILIGIERGDEAVKRLFERNKKEQFFISAISIQELYVGLGYALLKKGKSFFEKKKRIVDAIINDFHVVSITDEILKHAGLKQGELMAQGIITDTEDIIIGITAETMKFSKLFTKNPSHYEKFKILCES